jgi:hypothetical protein
MRTSSPPEGRFAIVTERRAWDAMDAVASGGSMIPEKWKPVFRQGSCSNKATGRKRRSVRRNRVVLAPRPWRYLRELAPAKRGQERPLPRGEHV